MIRPLRMRYVLDTLVAEGLLAAEGRATAVAATAALRPGDPWFLRVLIGGGAWVAAALIALGMVLADITESASALVSVGLLLIALPTAARARARHDFLVQLCLATCLVGQALFVAGVDKASHTAEGVSLASAALAAALVVLYRDVIMRFLAAAGFVVALVTLTELHAAVATQALLLLAMSAAAVLWLAPARWGGGSVQAARAPVASGLAVAVMGTLLTLHAFERGEDSAGAMLLRHGPTTVGMALLLCGLAVRLSFERMRQLVSEPVIATVVGVVLLAAASVTAPGILASVFVLALALARRGLVLVGLALAALITFTVIFYYDLEMTLLAKSGVLVGSGVVLIGARLYVAKRFRAAHEVVA